MASAAIDVIRVQKTIAASLSLLGPSILAAAAQGLGLVQIGLLLLPLGASQQTDAYFFLIAWTLVPSQILLLGVMYPVWLRGHTLGPRADRVLALGLPGAAVVVALIAASVFELLAASYRGLALHAVLTGCLGAATAIAWRQCLRESAEGRPAWMSAVTLVPNLTSCAVLGTEFVVTSGTSVTLALAGQLGGALVNLVMLRIGLRGRVPAPFEPTGLANAGVGWFSLQAATGYLSLVALQSMAATLPASSLSILGVATRSLAALNNLVTNAVLPRLVHRSSSDYEQVRRYLLAISWPCGAVLALLWLAPGVERFEIVATYKSIISIVVLWFLSATLNAAVKRIAIRTRAPRIAGVVAVLSVLPPAGLFIATLNGWLTLPIVVAALALMDLLPALTLAGIIREARALMLGAMTFGLLVAVVLAL